MTTTSAMSEMSGVRLRAAQERDWLAVEALLRDAGLPLAGARDALRDFLVAEGAGETLLGCAALEMYATQPGAAPTSALLRSLAVAPSARGLGLGASLVESLLTVARERGLADVTLLTTTAASYFPRFGFRTISRDAAPPAVRASVEFREACPDSAVVMTLAL